MGFAFAWASPTGRQAKSISHRIFVVQFSSHFLRDRSLFMAVRVDPECGTIVWPNGADMDPDVLYDLVHTAEGAGRCQA